MTGYLLDVNVLIALSWPGHRFHDLVQRWFARNSAKGWATCPLVEAGFVRILSNPAFSPRAVTPREAVAVLEANTRHPAHAFWPDSLSLAQTWAGAGSHVIGHQQITDAYLLALAVHHGAKLATADRGVEQLLGKGKERSHLEIIS